MQKTISMTSMTYLLNMIWFQYGIYPAPMKIMKKPFRTNHGLHLQQLDWTSKQVFGVSILTTQHKREVLYNSSKLNSGILHLLPNHFWRDGKLRSQNTYQQTNRLKKWLCWKTEMCHSWLFKNIGITYSWGAPPALFQGSEIKQIKLRTVSSAVCHRTLEAKPMAKGRIKRTSRAIEKGGNLWLTTYNQWSFLVPLIGGR